MTAELKLTTKDIEQYILDGLKRQKMIPYGKVEFIKSIVTTGYGPYGRCGQDEKVFGGAKVQIEVSPIVEE